jgi:hypothetical protein
MFTKNTVFILGAGGSWHYGYPTGDAVVEKVIQKATIVTKYLEHSLRVMHTERPDYIVDGQKPGHRFTRTVANGIGRLPEAKGRAGAS